MKKIPILIVFLFSGILAQADEGMWLINMLNKYQYKLMQEKGLTLPLDKIYNEEMGSLKDAVVALDYFSCTGEIISPKGLMITNHHCAYDDIQTLSSLKNNYLKYGFWAMSPEQEIPVKGKTVSFLIKIVDVSNEVADSILLIEKEGRKTGMWERRLFRNIQNKYKDDDGLEVSLEQFFRGQKHFLFYYKVYKDVRLVGAPPSSIAAYGGDTDNWMWPQHKADFSLYRIYGDKDGNPAAYSKNNVPLKTENFLEISLDGYKAGDFSMVIGYPGRTSRQVPAASVKRQYELVNPSLIQVREKKLAIWKEEMEKDEDIRIKYASKYFNESNYYKYAIGQNKYLKYFKVLEKKDELEKKLTNWIDEKETRRQKYGKLIQEINETARKESELFATDIQYINAIIRGAEAMPFVLRVSSLEKYQDPDEIKRKLAFIRKSGESFFDEFNIEIDKKVFAATLKIFIDNAEMKYIPSFVTKVMEAYAFDYDRMANSVYENSFLKNKEVFNTFLNNYSNEKLHADTLFQIHNEILTAIYALREKKDPFRDKLSELRSLYSEALYEYKKGNMYPDANSTMRLTYGEIDGFNARDGVYYDYYTSTEGYLEKEIPGDFEFDVFPEYKKLLESNDFGNYKLINGKMPVNFLSDNDITGGNSGSPVLNAKGQLIGLAFDGNWESMAADYEFVEGYTKCVNVDIRYVLFVIEKYGKASYLFEEMKFGS